MNQYYRVHAVIDLDAICHNIREVKRVVGEGVKVMPVIKADGYGHGAVPIAKELNKIGVDAFAVAILEEGITLRKQWNQTANLDFRIHIRISVQLIDSV